MLLRRGLSQNQACEGGTVLLWDGEWQAACGAAQGEAVAVTPAGTR